MIFLKQVLDDMLQQKCWAIGPGQDQCPKEACPFTSDPIPGAELRALEEEMPVFYLQ